MPQAQAYIEAGYKPGTQKQAHEAASKLARRPEVSKYLSELQESAYLANVLSLAEKRSFLADITRTPIGKVSLDSPLANSARYHDGELVEIRMPDKIKALELDAKLAGELRNDGTINIGLQLVNQRLETMEMPATLLPE
jgi:Terminase small subunit